ncbi:MAG: lysoplasmalogenase [Anaerolineales bacterium]
MSALPAPFQTLQWSLLIAWVLALAVAFVFGQPHANGARRSIQRLQRSTSGLLVVMAALFWAGGGRNTTFAAYTALVALGMAVSYVADLIMAETIRVPNRVLGGIGVFGLAHALYISAFLSAGNVVGAALWGRAALPLVGMLAIGLTVWRIFVRTDGAPSALNYGSLVYTGLISSMAGIALSLALLDGRFWPASVGALLFVVSDIILGNQIFRGNNWRMVGEYVWFTYISGQALIVWSSASILA